MKSLIIIFSLSIFGSILSLYLIVKRKQHVTAYCMDRAHCQVVLESKYNRIFWIHNDVMGFLGSLGIATITLLLIFNIGPAVVLRDLLIGVIGFGAAVSAALIYIQKFILRTWCFICVVSAINMFVIAFILFLTFSKSFLY